MGSWLKSGFAWNVWLSFDLIFLLGVLGCWVWNSTEKKGINVIQGYMVEMVHFICICLLLIVGTDVLNKCTDLCSVIVLYLLQWIKQFEKEKKKKRKKKEMVRFFTQEQCSFLFWYYTCQCRGSYLNQINAVLKSMWFDVYVCYMSCVVHLELGGGGGGFAFW